MIAAVALLSSLACVAACVRRLWLAAFPTAIHPDDVVAALGSKPTPASLARVREQIARAPDAEWEQALFAALSVAHEGDRSALVNEQLTELDHRIQRWARVPRVCASIASSVGFLLASLVMRRGLVSAGGAEVEITEGLMLDLVVDAVTVVALGFVGTAFAIGAHAQSRRMSRQRLAAADRMVEALEAASVIPIAGEGVGEGGSQAGEVSGDALDAPSKTRAMAEILG